MPYKSLSTANLPDPVIDPAQGSSPEDYFNTVLYTGDGTTDHEITGVGFQPDFVWIKPRSQAYAHGLFDAVRGTTKVLFTNNTFVEAINSGVISFDSDGFSVADDAGYNQSGTTHVAWNWKANGSGVSNTDGSITSTVSANTTSGFSIVSYSGNDTAGATVGHGLSQAPEVVIAKPRDKNDNWRVGHNGLTSWDYYLILNSTAAQANAANIWNDTAPSSTVFTLGDNDGINGSLYDYIAYCFHSVEGFSKFGSYTGTGSSRQFVYTGFRPAFILCKNTSGTGNWILHDTKRDPYNLMTANLYTNSSSAEGNTNMVDALSNGFEVAADFFGDNNASGSTYIYMAFAENPFKYSNAR